MPSVIPPHKGRYPFDFRSETCETRDDSDAKMQNPERFESKNVGRRLGFGIPGCLWGRGIPKAARRRALSGAVSTPASDTPYTIGDTPYAIAEEQ